MNNEVKLKNCPFCGSNDIDYQGVLYNDGKTSPQCMSCGATSESIEKWNQRISDDILKKLRIELVNKKNKCLKNNSNAITGLYTSINILDRYIKKY